MSSLLINDRIQGSWEIPFLSTEEECNISSLQHDLSPVTPTHAPISITPVNFVGTLPNTSLHSTPQKQSTPTKKRKKECSNVQEIEMNLGFKWEAYNYPSPPNNNSNGNNSSQPPCTCYNIFGSDGTLLTEQLSVNIQKIDSKSHFSPSDDAWICYRQNQFKVICDIQCPPGPLFVQDKENINGPLVAVVQLCAQLHAIRETGGLNGEETKTGIHHVGKTRVKKEKMEVDITPFVNGRVEFANLRFERSNTSKGLQPDYSRLVLTVYAQCNNVNYKILSQVSMRLIVRSQNPGFYSENLNNSQAETPDSNKSYESSPADTDSSPNSSHTPSPGSVYPSPTNSSTPSSMQFTFVNTPNPTPTPSVHPNTNGDYQQIPPPIHSNTLPPPYYPTNVPDNLSNINANIPPSNLNTSISPPPMPPYSNFSANNNINAKQTSDILVHYGKFGINTETPTEALTVDGNILVTGNMYKPSDQRIKSDITEIDSSAQLSHIRNIKIYDYSIRSRRERGVMAQELLDVMPEAVNNIGTVGDIPNFLVINERILLLENIGATQQLDKQLEEGKQTIVQIDSRVEELKQTTTQENLEVKNKMGNLFDVLFAEEVHDKTLLAGLEESFLNIGFSIFKMGPPSSYFLIGFLFPLCWSLGALYIFSNIHTRRIVGYSNLMMLTSYFALYYMTKFNMLDEDIFTKVSLIWLAIGIFLVLVMYVRQKRRQKKLERERNKEINLSQEFLLSPKTE